MVFKKVGCEAIGTEVLIKSLEKLCFVCKCCDICMTIFIVYRQPYDVFLCLKTRGRNLMVLLLRWQVVNFPSKTVPMYVQGMLTIFNFMSSSHTCMFECVILYYNML